MIDKHIDPDAPTRMEMAIDHHWDELKSKGETTFRSDEEDRTISMDAITEDCLVEFFGDGLHALTLQGLPFIDTLRNKIRVMKNDLMEEALEDYYK